MKPTSSRAKLRLLAPGAARPYWTACYAEPDPQTGSEVQLAVSVRHEDLPTAIGRLVVKLSELGLLLEIVQDADWPLSDATPSAASEADGNGHVSKLTVSRLRDVVIPEQPAGGAPTERPRTAAPVTPRRRAKGGAR